MITTTKEQQKIEVQPVMDVLDMIGGRWKFPILYSLCQGKKRFKELERNLVGITPKMLTQELRCLESNDLVKREVFPTVPVTVEYSITEWGRTLEPVLQTIQQWGKQHRERILKSKVKES